MAPPAKTPKGKLGKSGKTSTKFVVDASKPASDKIFDAPAFEQFLLQRIKVDGRTGNLGDKVTVEALESGKIEVVATNLNFSGRYLKYLTKKFLKKNQLRDWLRVVSTSKRTYTLKFFNVVNDAEEEDED